MSTLPDARQYAPATQRNREPILTVLRQYVPQSGTILEVSSGSGEHAVYFAARLMPRLWLPSDCNPVALASISAWRAEADLANLCAPMMIDAEAPVWAVEQPLDAAWAGLNWGESPIGAVVNINMIHIAPWSACVGLMAGAGRILPSEGILYLYGPFQQGGQHTAPSNAAFDQRLRSQNPSWGVRHLEDVIAVAQSQGLQLVDTVPMPANNLSVIFRAAAGR